MNQLRKEEMRNPIGGAPQSTSRPSSKEPFDDANSRPRIPLELRAKITTVGGVAHDIAKRKLSVEENNSMDIDSPVKSIRSIRHLRHGDSERTHKSLNTSRHRGKEKGTVIWRVQPEMGDLVVREKETASCDPSLSLEQAVKTAKPGARIFVQGEHSWTGTLVLDKRVQIVGAGAWVTTLNGRWLLQDKDTEGTAEQFIGCQEAFDSVRPTIGGFSGVHLCHTLGQGRQLKLSGNYMTETLVIRQGSWRFHSCKITSDGSPPMLLSGRADVRALECRIGGRGAGSMRSSSGVIVTGDSKCALDTCVLENTDDSSYTEVADCAGVRRSMPPEYLSPFAQQFAQGVGASGMPSPTQMPQEDQSLQSFASPDTSFLRSMSSETSPSYRKRELTEENFQSTAILVRHTASIAVDCCKFVHNYVAITIADCAHAVVNNSLFHEHNDGAVFGILSAGDHVRASVLEVKDNKIARTQDRRRTAIGRPGRYLRKDGLGTWEELEPEVRRSLARLDSLFEAETDRKSVV